MSFTFPHLEVARDSLKFHMAPGETVELDPVLMATVQKSGRAGIIDVGADIDEVRERVDGLFEEGKVEKRAEFVAPGESDWWDSEWSPASYSPSKKPKVPPPQVPETVIFWCRPFQAATWSQTLIPSVLVYLFGVNWKGRGKWAYVLRPNLSVRISDDFSDGERRFLEWAIRSSWRGPLALGRERDTPARLADAGTRIAGTYVPGMLLACGALATVQPSNNYWWGGSIGVAFLLTLPLGLWVARKTLHVAAVTQRQAQREHWTDHVISSLMVAVWLGPILLALSTMAPASNFAFTGEVIKTCGEKSGKFRITLEGPHGRRHCLPIRPQERAAAKVGNRVSICYLETAYGMKFRWRRAAPPRC